MLSWAATVEAVAINVALSVDKATIIENRNATTITVTVTSPSAFTTEQITTVHVGKSTDSATEGTDYATVNDFNITIPANASSATGTSRRSPAASNDQWNASGRNRGDDGCTGSYPSRLGRGCRPVDAWGVAAVRSGSSVSLSARGGRASVAAAKLRFGRGLG